MNQVYNIVKLENLKEYLSRKGASQRLLKNPRIYEILDNISYDLNIIFLDEEMQKFLDERLSVERDGSITYLKGLKRCKVSRNSDGIETVIDVLDKNSSSIMSEKRLFDMYGIEYLYEIRRGTLDVEDFGKNIGFVPLQRIKYSRDNAMINFITKEEIGKFVVKEHLIQQVPYMLQNLKLSKKEISRINNKATGIEDLCGLLTRNQAEYDMYKKIFCENASNGQEEIFKTYCNYNRRYQLPDTYEKGIAKKLGIEIERKR